MHRGCPSRPRVLAIRSSRLDLRPSAPIDRSEREGKSSQARRVARRVFAPARAARARHQRAGQRRRTYPRRAHGGPAQAGEHRGREEDHHRGTAQLLSSHILRREDRRGRSHRVVEQVQGHRRGARGGQGAHGQVPHEPLRLRQHGRQRGRRLRQGHRRSRARQRRNVRHRGQGGPRQGTRQAGAAGARQRQSRPRREGTRPRRARRQARETRRGAGDEEEGRDRGRRRRERRREKSDTRDDEGDARRFIVAVDDRGGRGSREDRGGHLRDVANNNRRGIEGPEGRQGSRG